MRWGFSGPLGGGFRAFVAFGGNQGGGFGFVVLAILVILYFWH